ncbi:PIF1 [Candida pseudojiufengensis]|uniref:PIF1 n=1 Tax=Candida pseudojiufengensis TaxID=497109 RepID=UPI002224C2A6|nr:PIF1 [Candida pseudojiufengensis]KAI5958455.1 PIF1 [Candida pseudojiufengensis]
MNGVKVVTGNALNKKLAVLDGIDFSDSFGEEQEPELESELDVFESIDENDICKLLDKTKKNDAQPAGSVKQDENHKLPYNELNDSFTFTSSINLDLEKPLEKRESTEVQKKIQIGDTSIKNKTCSNLIEDLHESFEFSDHTSSLNAKQVKQPSPEFLFSDDDVEIIHTVQKSHTRKESSDFGSDVELVNHTMLNSHNRNESSDFGSDVELVNHTMLNSHNRNESSDFGSDVELVNHTVQKSHTKDESFDFGSDDDLVDLVLENLNTPAKKRPASSQQQPTPIIKRHHSPTRSSTLTSSDIIKIGMNSSIELSEQVIAPPRRSLAKIPTQSSPTTPLEPLTSNNPVSPAHNSPSKIIDLRKKFNIPTVPASTRNYSTNSAIASAALTSTSKSSKPQSNHTLLLATQRPNIESSNLPDSKPQSGKIVQPIILSKEQEAVLQQVLKGVSLFYTGSAGTGKSVLLRSIIKALRDKHGGGVAVTASTGLAACNIGGTTLHRFGGIGLGQASVKNLVKKIKRNQKAVKRWQDTKVLIIDEISMVDGILLDKLSEIAQKIRDNTLPFGGIQLVACGDFYQLPPVVKNDQKVEKDIEVLFSFECDAWKETIQQTIILKEIFRQKGDQTFIDMLNEMRDGKLSERTISEFQRLSRPLPCPDGIVPAELYATRAEVESANKRRLNALKGQAIHYRAKDSGILPEPDKSRLLQNFLAPLDLYLKVDAQVMCIKNFDETLVNGSLGQVVDFMDRDTYMKAYGPTEEENVMDDEMLRDFVFNEPATEPAEPAPSTSKIIASKSLSQQNLSPEEQTSLERKKELNDDLMGDFKNKKYPLVKFSSPDGVNSRTVLVEPENWTVEDEEGKVLVSRVQFPLMLAWSLSIHKSQGQTLSRVKVDLKRVFENGQSYVALSRATSREGLQVLNFLESKVTSNPKVIKFYKSLQSVYGNKNSEYE